MDEMEVNERAAAQVDMDAVSDEAAMTDSDEESSAEEADVGMCHTMCLSGVVAVSPSASVCPALCVSATRLPFLPCVVCVVCSH